MKLDFSNKPEQTRVTEADFLFEPILLDDFYRFHTLRVIFLAQKPKSEQEAPLPEDPLEMVDDSFTRSVQIDLQKHESTQPLGKTLLENNLGLIAKSVELFRQHGLKAFIRKMMNYLIAKLRKKWPKLGPRLD